ncbi:MAG: ATP synthase F1 subunit delta [Myxococcota bacterium]
MADGSLARRYARALLDLGRESNKIDAFNQDLETFGAVLALEDGALRFALYNPGLSIAERKSVLEAVLARLELNGMTNNFLKLLVDKNRLSVFDEIQAAYREMADELAGRVRAAVTTATPLSEDNAARIQQVLADSTGRQVIVDFAVDPELIGGIVARIGDTVYDASVRSRLQRLKETIAQ